MQCFEWEMAALSVEGGVTAELIRGNLDATPDS